MQALRRSRTFARLLAAWLLLWFAAMGMQPWRADTAAGQRTPNAVAHAGHAEGPRDETHGSGHAHAGHAVAGSVHCPLCLHAAAPPPPLLSERLPDAAPLSRPAVGSRTLPRVRTDVPPPARGPPLLS